MIAIPSTADDDSVEHVEDDLEASVPSTTRSGGQGEEGDVPTMLLIG